MGKAETVNFSITLSAGDYKLLEELRGSSGRTKSQQIAFTLRKYDKDNSEIEKTKRMLSKQLESLFSHTTKQKQRPITTPCHKIIRFRTFTDELQ